MHPLLLELRLSDTSVPGLMQDVGDSLRIANLVVGDILTSVDESSRPSTALDDVGTPRESSAMFNHATESERIRIRAQCTLDPNTPC